MADGLLKPSQSFPAFDDLYRSLATCHADEEIYGVKYPVLKSNMKLLEEKGGLHIS